MGDLDYLLLYANSGQTGETAFLFPESPKVVVAHGAANTSFASGVLRLNYDLSGMTVVNINTTLATLVVVIMEKAIANTWHAPLLATSNPLGNFFSIGSNATVLVGGPYLVRDAEIVGSNLSLVSLIAYLMNIGF